MFRLGIRKYSSKPLNVLFFGSDEFSALSLNALVSLQGRTDLIKTLQVVSRPPKWCGRKKSVLKTPPIVELCESLKLRVPLHVDTRDDMLKLDRVCEKEDINMIIAVSFGKLIPGELLGAVPYSLNVHPSLLPRYKGSAPLQHTLLNNDNYTGVTIQTLHPTKFDHGSIVAQTAPLPVFDLLNRKPVAPLTQAEDTRPRKLKQLMDQLGLVGGHLLQEVIEQGLYINNKESSTYESSYAKRITTEDKMINWKEDTAEQLLNKLETLGPIFAFKTCQLKEKNPIIKKRVLLHDFEVINSSDAAIPVNDWDAGKFSLVDDKLVIQCKDKALLVSKIQFEACAIEDPTQFMRRLPKRCGKLYGNELQLY
ncbi:Methionyl-tRNA formyltransferase, mitochondrial [Nakaseomyces bracarensis]|uniref:Methionyl-tRNA formyltransferase, mitochondrial n=1 Tax=Nakaseomyces bracarensis TaxID=273131 RepID=A0ABR4NTI2_9SACH